MDIAAFNWVDGLVLGLIIFSTLISFVRGFVREAISLVTWIAAFWIAHQYGQEFATRFLTMIEVGQMRSIIAAAILFFAVLLVGAFINYSINSFVNVTGLSPIDRILGMAFGFARGILLVAVLMLLGQLTQLDKKPWWAESQLIPEFSGVTEWLKSFVPEQFEKLKQIEEQKKEENKVPMSQQTTSGPLSPVAKPSTGTGDTGKAAKATPPLTTTTTTITTTNLLSPPDKKQPPVVEQANTTEEPAANPAYY